MVVRKSEHRKESEYLLVSRIGRKSLHSKWLNGSGSRKFDVYLSCYDPQVPEVCGDGVYFERRMGRKVAGYNGFLKECSAIWLRYDYICLMDEDIDADVDILNKMFDVCSEYNLKIAQPALTLDSHFTYAALLQQARWKLRFVNFVEMMCPVFRRDVLQEIGGLYSMGFESGIDLIWCNLVVDGEFDFAVIDIAAVRHTEPVGSNKSANGFTEGKSYEDDIYMVLNLFGIPWLSCVPFSGVDLAGKETRSRLLLAMSIVSVVPAIWKQHPWKSRARAVFDHIRHTLRARPRNIKIQIESDYIKPAVSSSGATRGL